MCGSNSGLGTLFLEDIAVSRTTREMALCQEAGVLKVAIVSIDVLAAERR